MIYLDVIFYRDDEQKKHNRLKPYGMLDNFEKETYREPIRSVVTETSCSLILIFQNCVFRHALKALISLNWQIEYGEQGFSSGFAQNQVYYGIP